MNRRNPTNPVTYCTNIHPGDGWGRIFSNLQAFIPDIKKAVSPNDSFPIGLWLSNRACLEIDADASIRFGEWCRENDCHVATINGFPYGSFHDHPVKHDVYMPDWSRPERVEYTKRLARLLDLWLPDCGVGSISTLPISFKADAEPGSIDLIRRNLMEILTYLDQLMQKSGRKIILALEPEPGCVLETASEAIGFFERMGFPPQSAGYAGICFDCCHQAVEFEPPADALAQIMRAGIPVPKIQVSSALRIRPGGREILEKFVEPCYLHQTVIRKKDGTLKHYHDLPEALCDYPQFAEDEWRIHFHVPIFIEKIGPYETTRHFIEEILAAVDPNILLEIETYTWHVLPSELQTSSVDESIVREIRWVKSKLDEKNRCA